MAQANPTGWEFLDQGPNEGLLNSAFDPDGARHFGVPPPHPPTRYGSPWFNRFGGRSDTVLNDIANIGFPESGFAPHAPEFRPKAGPPPGAPMRIPRFTEDFWKQNPDTEDVFGFPLTQPPWGDLDLLMATEQQQIEWQAGLTTAEAVVTQQIFNKGTLVLTKESTWASVFKRARWYDFNVPIVHDRHFPRNFVPETIESATQWKPGEAGNPTWRVLAPCIHLADLWLKQMAKGEWLRTLFFSHSERLHEGVDIEAHPDWKDVPGHGPQYWRREPDPDMEKATTVPAIATDIGEYIFKKLHRQYAPRIVWRLVDEDHYPVPPKSFGNVHFLGQTTEHCYTWHEDSDGGEDSLLEGNDIDSYFCTIDIHVQNIRPLISVDTTDHEKAIAMFKTAAGILHELMHAIDLINRRFTDKDIDNTDPDTPHRRAHEYYYKKEWIAELGASAMNSLFGGDLQVTPAVDAESAKGTRYMLSVYDFPSVQQSLFPQRMISKWLSDPDKGTHDIGSVTTQSPIPISWISAMLQKDFYKAVIEPLGLQAFRIPRVWDSKSRRAGYYTIVRPPQPKDPLDFPWHAVTSERFSTLIDQLEQTAKDVDARRTIWYKARPWQVMNQLEWRKTPYAFTEFRMLVMRFRELADPACEADFRRRFDPWAPLNLSVFREHQAEFLLKNLNDYVDKSDEPMAPNYWPMYVLSLMMRAAMPGRPSPDPDCKRETGPFWAPRNRWTPSSFTSAAHQFDPVGNPRWEFPEVRAVRPEQIVAKSRHTESYAEPDANRRVGMPDRVYNGREWKLIRAEQCLALYSEQYPIPNLLQAAIERQLRHLFIAAQERPLNEWLPFNFQFPAYHPSNLVTTHAVTRSDVLGRPRREVWYAAREAWHIVPFSALHQSVPGDEPPRLEDMYALKPEFARDRDFTIPGSGLAPHPSGAEGQGQVDATARVVREWFRDRFGPSMRRWRQNLSRRGPTDTASWPRWKKRPGNMPPRRYYSVSEVAENHWCLVMDEDGGYVVVDLSSEYTLSVLSCDALN
ncbi:hypothetical protein QBC35DRAFT_211096 [Podospora australis]|uniref:Uncharacterized protein n=1 Tax=Podospora australis TaxID=1536484 RepID=A0AAN6WTZ0_9PEZI|nr:hypothetical protein QBC35DRAFT_211096 [Podospora australis]